QTLLRAVVHNPDQPITALPLLTATERDELLTKWNDTAVDYPKARSLHQLFEEQVERTPNAVAVVEARYSTSDDLRFTNRGASDNTPFVTRNSQRATQLTYRELNNRANQLAHFLRELGVGPEVMVGICAERSIAMVVGLLGILKAGGAYVPLDPTYPQERLAFLIDDAQVPILLTQDHLQAGLPVHDATVLCLDGDWREIATRPIENPQSAVTAETLAYMIYTSGSTGRPKGAMIPHRAIVNRLLWMQDEYRLTAQDHILQKTPFSFDVSVWEFFWPLLTGARLVMAEPGGHTEPAYLVQTIQAQAITVIHFVPPMLQLFLEAEGVEACTTLRTVICSGEALPVELERRFFAKLSANLHNLYGPTEAAVDVSYWACQPDHSRTTVPIGHPVANTQLYILDPYGEPVPVGVPGELHIGGSQVGCGYHNRPELTAVKFTPNPFGAGTLYKTGDLTRYLSDGAIEFLGRIDNQVKIRGFRIELGEIEALLAEHPAIQAALLLVREDIPGQKRLVAYITEKWQRGNGAEWQNGTEPLAPPALDLVELRGFLQQKLPDHMIPAAFVVLDALPLTPNGKVDRRALPAPDTSALAVNTAYAPPRSAVEKTLVTLWQELLRVEGVGIHDNFFALGGDSILSIQLIARAKQAGIALTPKQIFQHQTIAKLADVAGTIRSVHAEQGLVSGTVPLTPIQQWYLAQAQPQPQHFNQSVLLTVRPDLDMTSLERALQTLWHHHDGLRLHFVQEDGAWQQINGGIEMTGGSPSPRFTQVKLSTLEEEARSRVLAAKAEEIQASFELATGPLIHVAYFDCG
ncbi:MAG: amino acid adenylation domain-containing protein, partial [Caldilineaceae bacterium]|nr:amino acid adenylation domain-containing protein [Caldilineaceae bacterium]